MVSEGERDDAIIMSGQLLKLFHLGPVVDPNLPVVAARVKMVVHKLHSQHPAAQPLD